MTYRYDKNTDYQKLIDEAKKSGDYTAAAVYEQQRNAKIEGEGLSGVSKTNLYSNYLPDSSTTNVIVNHQLNSPQQNDWDTINQRVQAQNAMRKARYNTPSNPYQDKQDALAEKILNQTYSYDPNTDPMTVYLKDSYTQGGQRAMQDAIAQASARTGGIASSYATAAGQQQYNQYMQGLQGALIDAENNAYNRYLQNLDVMFNQMSMLSNLAQQKENSQYAQIEAAMQRWATLGYADEQVAATLGVAPGTLTSDQKFTAWQQEMSEKQYADGLSATDQEFAANLALQILQTGKMPSDEVLAAADISQADAQILADYYAKQRSSGQTVGQTVGIGSYSYGGDTYEQESTQPTIEMPPEDYETTMQAISSYLWSQKIDRAKSFLQERSALMSAEQMKVANDYIAGYENVGPGLPQESYAALLERLEVMMESNRSLDAHYYADWYWPQLNSAQRQEIRKNIFHYSS